MSTFAQVEQDRNAARKARNQFEVTTLSTLIGEVQTKHRSGDKDYADIDKATLKVIKKTIEACNELYAVKKDEKSLLEIEILERYIPKQLSDTEIQEILDREKFENVPAVMQFFKKSNLPVDMNQVRNLYTASLKA